jgi:GTP diphosphokinase / guanosine-3',5'-bis(diphosphate) 3'-diphosphatase
METNEKDSAYRQEMVNRYRSLVRNHKPELDKEELKLVRLAFNIALSVSKNKHKIDGEPYIFYPLSIAKIVSQELSLGTSSIISAFLYTFVQDKLISIQDVELKFGKQISQIVDGLTKIAGIETKTAAHQVDNFRKLILSLSTDVRVIFIKLAERLEDMRSMDKQPESRQIKVASETLDLYSPLSHRLGLYNIKSELEDLSLKYTDTEVYHSIEQKLKDTTAKRNRFIRDFIKPIKDELQKQGLDFEIKSRLKSIFSIRNKMRKQNVDFDEIFDIFAIRIILNSELEQEKTDCWRAYSVVTGLYQPNPERLRDWISVPKTNGYESLHTTVVVPGGNWVEVQIRTQRMNEIAEKGFAAHWRYKGIEGDQGIDGWLNKVREVLESPMTDDKTFMEDFKLNLYNDEIFVFTPNGDLRKLPLGATVLDFAFDIHSGLGSTCVGAKVNNRNVPIRFLLQNGDRVEILTSKNQKPKEDWLEFVITSKAKAKIKLAIKEEKSKQAESGREILQRRLRNWKIPFNDLNINKLQKNYKLKTAVDLYCMIADDKIDLAEIKELLTDDEIQTKHHDKIEDSLLEKIVKPSNTDKSEDFLIIDDKISDLHYQLSKCCNPIFGDPIFGFVTINEGIKIHRTNCPNAHQMISRYEYRVVKAKWTSTESDPFFQAVVKVTGIDEMGTVSHITDIIQKDQRVNMRSINIETEDGMFEGIIKLFVRNTVHLEVLIRKIAKVKGVLKVSRTEGSV